MQALKLIIGADATPFVAAMKTLQATSVGAANVSAAALRKSISAIEEHAAALKGAGQDTIFFDSAVAKLTNQLAALTAQEHAAKNAANDLATAQARIAMGWGGRGDYETIGKAIAQGRLATPNTPIASSGQMQGPDLSGKMRAGAGMGGGTMNKGWGGASSAMFVSVARDTAASLASGANPITVFMQQAPQVLQALTMIGKEALMKFGMLLLKVLPIVAVLTALGVVAYKVHNYFKILGNTIENAANKFGAAQASIAGVNAEMLKGVDAARSYAKWLKEMEDTTVTLSEKTQSLLDVEKARAELESRKANNRGASPAEMAKIEQGSIARQIKIVKDALEASKKEEAAAKKAVAVAEKQSRSRETAALATEANQAKERSGEYATAMQEVRGKLGLEELERGAKRGDTFREAMQIFQQTSVGAVPTGRMSPAVSAAEELERRKTQAQTVKVGGKEISATYYDLQRGMKAGESDYKKLSGQAAAPGEALTEQQKKAGEAKDATKNLTKQLADLTRQQTIEQVVENKSGRSGRGVPDVNEMQRIGLRAVGNNPMIDISKASLKELKQINQKLGGGVKFA